MKVLIADDEIHICTLLKHLIDWEELGLELGGMFSSGQEVLEYLSTETADILICDIEMPGVDGIELMQRLSKEWPEMKIVVVSGFRNFEYARSAMQYGASNYLLKPIDESELNEVLKAIVTSVWDNPKQKSMMMRVSGRLQFFDLMKKSGIKEDLSCVNRNYNYQFAEGTFRCLRIVFPGKVTENDTPQLIMRMFEEILRPKLSALCQEFEFFREDSVNMCVLLNSDKEEENAVSFALDGILHNAIVELGCKTQSRVYIGVGFPVREFHDIYLSYKSAENAVCARIYKNDCHILYAGPEDDKINNSEILTAGERREFGRFIEEIEPDSAGKWIEQVFHRNETLFHLQPPLVFECCRKILLLFSNIMEDISSPLENKENFVAQSMSEIDSCMTEKEIRIKLAGIIENIMNEKLSVKLANLSAYAQQAKRYIEKHYMENITLETIAGQLNINPTYLSVVFKNEVKMNYSKYLTMVRMENAKELLRKCDKNLTQIAHAVGYDRTAYFSSVFKTYTGIKPMEYQRLYQKGVSE